MIDVAVFRAPCRLEDGTWTSKYMSWSEGLEACEADDGAGPVLTEESELSRQIAGPGRFSGERVASKL